MNDLITPHVFIQSPLQQLEANDRVNRMFASERQKLEKRMWSKILHSSVTGEIRGTRFTKSR